MRVEELTDLTHRCLIIVYEYVSCSCSPFSNPSCVLTEKYGCSSSSRGGGPAAPYLYQQISFLGDLPRRTCMTRTRVWLVRTINLQ